VAPDADDTARHAEIDSVLQQWRQGDCALGPYWFVFRIDPNFPLTESGQSAAKEGVELVEEQVEGLVVVSQACDIVRSCKGRPYLEVCALVRVDAATLHDIKRGRKPMYAFVPGLSDKCLVADLDRVMTVEKAAALTWARTRGCFSDADLRAFAQALSRKRSRFAFPNDFTALVRRLVNRLGDKHDKNTPEGRALRALREIRVQAAPSWMTKQSSCCFGSFPTRTIWILRDANGRPS